ncbi:MAG: PqqD family protein [Bacteroidales bacterium]
MEIKKNIAISETGFVFDPSTGDSFSLNPVGLEIMGFLREGKTREEIAALITDKYDVEKGAFERYFYDFVSMLKHHQILQENETN